MCYVISHSAEHGLGAQVRAGQEIQSTFEFEFRLNICGSSEVFVTFLPIVRTFSSGHSRIQHDGYRCFRDKSPAIDVQFAMQHLFFGHFDG